MPRILALQHDHDDPPGFVGTLLDSYQLAYDIVDVTQSTLPDITHYQAIVAFGGAQHVYDREAHPYFEAEKHLIRQAITQDIPYLGICLGSQLLADALGGTVRKHILTEIGFFDVQFTEAGKQDPLFDNLPGYQTIFHWHEDTFDLPAGATLLATSNNTINQAFRYGKRAYGVQYHIELDYTTLDRWLNDSSLPESMERIIGPGAYQRLMEERSKQFPQMQQHTTIMMQNFLHLSELLPKKIE